MPAQPGKLLRVYVNEYDKYEGRPIYEAIVERCRELNVAGATAFRALEGFGETSQVHRRSLFGGDAPIVISIVESPEKAREVLPVLQSMISSGLIAITDVEVTVISNGADSSRPGPVRDQ